MPDRIIGTWASGKRHLGAALEALQHHEFTAAQIMITRPGTRALIEVEDLPTLQAMAREMRVFVHAPYVDTLFPPLVQHGQRMGWFRRLGREVETIGAGLILHMGDPAEYLDTAQQAAAQLLDVIPETVPVYIENAGVTLREMVRIVGALKHTRPNLWVCLDTAQAWSLGWGALAEEEDPAHRDKAFRLLQPYVGLLHLNNTYAVFGSRELGDYFPLFSGNIAIEQFAGLLRAFPQVPVVLERSNHLQSVVDRQVVLAIDRGQTETLAALRDSPVMGALST